MSRTYSTYEAKARFSEVLRQVRAGHSIVIEYRGEPVAEMRRIEPAEPGLAGRLARLKVEGALHPQPAGKRALRSVARRPGALKRFLQERD
jgi:antitoxin (DNA-binding transcriptional repressor) of toxin-antitoxin stability system